MKLCKGDCEVENIDQELADNWNYCPYCGVEI
jgi:hypothetical protein